MKREKIIDEEKKGNYFTSEKKHINFVSSGSILLDCVLSGGYPLGRIVNIIGDASSGKSLLCIEAITNFIKKYSNGSAYYHETESAFDKSYAEALGLPIESVEFVRDDDKYENTVEFLFESLSKRIELCIKKDIPAIYIVDSLDALSNAAELEREFDASSYGGDKAKKMSELFRRITDMVEKSKVLLIIVSQVRENIGVTFGAKYKRSGGKALDFYASQIIWLAETGKIKKTIRKVDRVIGVNVKAKCSKNKVGIPFRECEYPIIFGYGIDDYAACQNWLKKIGEEVSSDITPEDLANKTAEVWREIEDSFLPTKKKYN